MHFACNSNDNNNQLTHHTVPALTLLAIVMALSMSFVMTLAARPYVVSLAREIASSIVLNLKID